MEKQLEAEVSKAQAVVVEWENTVAMIATQFQAANLAVVNAKKVRQENALKASMRDAAAVAAIKLAQKEQFTAELTIEDLKVALPDAERRGAMAEQNAQRARRALANFHVDALKRERVVMAGELDLAIAHFARLYCEFERLGDEICNMPDVLPRNIHGMMDHSGAMGARRLRAALPKFLEQVFPNSLHDEMKREPLATSEARFWNLPEQPEKVKAA